jgi:hypothetical protein
MRWVFGAIAVLVTAAIASGDAVLEQKQRYTLTPIDSVPTRQQIDLAYSGSPQTALQNLSTIAIDVGADVGIRLRAIHALPKYCAASTCTETDVAHATVVSVIEANMHETVGSPILILRAGIETMGAMRSGSAGDVDLLIPLLNHASRDIRTSTARALQGMCASGATTAMRVRYSHEPTEQVKLAISEALRALGNCSTNP